MTAAEHLGTAVLASSQLDEAVNALIFLFELGFLSLPTKRDLTNANTSKYI